MMEVYECLSFIATLRFYYISVKLLKTRFFVHKILEQKDANDK